MTPGGTIYVSGDGGRSWDRRGSLEGAAGQAQALLLAARDGASDPLLLGDIARLRGHIEVNLGSAAEAHRIFVEAAQEVYPFDPARALDIGVAAAVMRTFGADSRTPLPVTDALVSPDEGDPPRTHSSSSPQWPSPGRRG